MNFSNQRMMATEIAMSNEESFKVSRQNKKHHYFLLSLLRPAVSLAPAIFQRFYRVSPRTTAIPGDHVRGIVFASRQLFRQTATRPWAGSGATRLPRLIKHVPII